MFRPVTNSIERSKGNKRTTLLAVLLTGAGLLAYAGPLVGLFRGALQDQTFSYIVFIPLISISLIYESRKRIFGGAPTSAVPGVVLLSAGILIFFVARQGTVGPTVPLGSYALHALSAVLTSWGILGLLFGAGALWAARFPLLFLCFMIPIPAMILNPIVRFLQTGSAEISYWVIRLLGVPILREGFVFSLPGLSIEVAAQCSGIRSSLSLLIVGVLAGHFFLKSGWTRLALVAAVVPIAIAKNGLRIVTLSLYGAYVNPRILEGSLHRAGGIPFFLVALSMLAVVLWLLRRFDSVTGTR